MDLPDVVIQCATCPSELPPHIAKQIGTMWLRRYWPDNPSVAAIRAFKAGTWVGALAWALRGDGKVLGWGLRAKTDKPKRAVEVMAFVSAKFRRHGLGDALLNECLRWYPAYGEWVLVYRHDKTAAAFYEHRDARYKFSYKAKATRARTQAQRPTG